MTTPTSPRTLCHADFVPRALQQRLLAQDVYESVSAAVQGASVWINAHGVDVVNIETVVLPNLHQEEGSTDASLRTSGEMSSSWHQFIRVWYWHHG